MVSYTLTQSARFAASVSAVLHFLQEEPLKFLEVIHVDVKENLSDYKQGNDTGEWALEEPLTIPCVPKAKIRTRWTRQDKGCRWDTTAALGVCVDSVTVIDHTDDNVPDSEQGHAGSKDSCQVRQVATVSSPFYVYPIVRWQFVKAQKERLLMVQKFASTLPSNSTPTTSPPD